MLSLFAGVLELVYRIVSKTIAHTGLGVRVPSPVKFFFLKCLISLLLTCSNTSALRACYQGILRKFAPRTKAFLFEKLSLGKGKKNKTGYVTDANVLGKLIEYPIVKLILEYRLLNKLYTTYLEGILSSVAKDGKIHTIYTQALTRTGRLSSIEPNLQNIPARSEYGRLIRNCFIPDAHSVILSSDYSQIELRIFASLVSI